jgi:hypothetical protein
MGSVGPHARHRAGLAIGVQEPAAVREYRGNLQAAGNVAGEAGAGIERGDAQHDGGDEIQIQGRLRTTAKRARNFRRKPDTSRRFKIEEIIEGSAKTFTEYLRPAKGHQ